MSEDDAIIARQVRRIGRLERQGAYVRKALNDAATLMVGIGGPLNDNLLAFTPPQKSLVRRVHGLISDALAEMEADDAVADDDWPERNASPFRECGGIPGPSGRRCAGGRIAYESVAYSFSECAARWMDNHSAVRVLHPIRDAW